MPHPSVMRCKDSKFNYSVAGYVITGKFENHLRIQNRHIVSKGPKTGFFLKLISKTVGKK